MIWFIRKWLFIGKRLAFGDSVAQAKNDWTLICIRIATERAYGHGMGRVIVTDGKDNMRAVNLGNRGAKPGGIKGGILDPKQGEHK